MGLPWADIQLNTPGLIYVTFHQAEFHTSLVWFVDEMQPCAFGALKSLLFFLKTMSSLTMPSFLHLHGYYLSSCHLKPLMKQAEREGGKEHHSSHRKVRAAPSSFQTIFYIANREGKPFLKSNLMVMSFPR